MRPSVFSDELQALPGDAGFGGQFAPVGIMAGAERLGASLYELSPGQSPFPYHFHRGNEELLVVLRGRPTLRTPEGERELAEGEVVAFRAGPEGAHQLVNRGSEPARYLMLSTRRTPEMVQYPDSAKVGVASFPQPGDESEGPVRFIFAERDQSGYYDDEQAPG